MWPLCDCLDACLSVTVSPEGQKSDPLNWLALSSVQQGISDKSTETAAPAGSAMTDYGALGKSLSSLGLSFPTYSKMYLN